MDITVVIEDAQPINISLGEAVNIYEGGIYTAGPGISIDEQDIAFSGQYRTESNSGNTILNIAQGEQTLTSYLGEEGSPTNEARVSVVPQGLTIATQRDGSVFGDYSFNPDYVKLGTVPSDRNDESEVTATNFLYTDSSGNVQSGKLHHTGTTAQRPTQGLEQGFEYFDTTLDAPVWWNGSEWVEIESGGGGGTPGGVDKSIQFNDNGTFNGDPDIRIEDGIIKTIGIETDGDIDVHNGDVRIYNSDGDTIWQLREDGRLRINGSYGAPGQVPIVNEENTIEWGKQESGVDAPAYTGLLVNNNSFPSSPQDSASYSLENDPDTFAVRKSDGTLSVNAGVDTYDAVVKGQLDMIEEELFTDIQNMGETKVNKSGDVMTGSLGIASSYPSDDVPGGIDGTRRLNLHSFQRAHTNTFGETIRHFLMRKDAKAMEAYYIPKLGYNADRTPKADLNTDGTPANIAQWQPVSWTGSHYEANDHLSNHVHWELEIPDSTGALQGRLEVPFANPTTGVVGLDKTNIRTNLADLTVRTSNNQVLRLSSPQGNHKPIEFNNDSEGSTAFRRWILRSNSTAEAVGDVGNDFQIINYANDGTLLSQAVHIQRSTGNVVLGSATPTTGVKLDINGGRIRLRTSTPPTTATSTGTAGEIAWDTNYIYTCVATNTWKRSPLSTW